MVYTANWGIICYLPPFRGARNNHWLYLLDMVGLWKLSVLDLLGGIKTAASGWIKYCTLLLLNALAWDIGIRITSWSTSATVWVSGISKHFLQAILSKRGRDSMITKHQAKPLIIKPNLWCIGWKKSSWTFMLLTRQRIFHYFGPLV